MEENKILAYVRGNDVLFIVTVTTPERDEYGQPVYGDDELQLVPVDFTGWDDYSLRVVKQGVTRTIVAESSQLVEGEDGKIVVDVPYTAQCGTYSLELVGRQNGRHERSYEIMMFAIVESNDKANLIYEIIDGYKSTDLDITVQMVSSALVYGENAYQMWKHLPGNEDKTLQDYIDEVLDLVTITENARHPDYVGEDNYVYRWDTETQSYYNTDIYVKGERGLKGDKGDKGDTGATGATGAQGIQGEQGEKGDPFTYSDFTAEQLAALRGPQGDKGDKGDPMRYEDLSPAQIESLRGPKGDTGATGATGATGPAGQDGVTPHIDSTSKHWFIGSTDTGIVAVGTTPDLSNYVQKSSTAGLLKNDGTVDPTSYGTYSKPSGGIPSTDLSSAVQTSLGKADTAIQTETDPTVPSWAKQSSKPSYTASEVGAVPTTRTVNGKALSSDVTLSASDVGALPDDTPLFSGDYNDLDNKPSIPDVSNKEDVTQIVAQSSAISTLTAEVGKYYRFDVAVETLAITLPTMTGVTNVKTITFYMTGGTTPGVTFTSTHNVYLADFTIESGKTYEVNAAWNGASWIVAAVNIVISNS